MASVALAATGWRRERKSGCFIVPTTCMTLTGLYQKRRLRWMQGHFSNEQVLVHSQH